jgi:hypothetical protein
VTGVLRVPRRAALIAIAVLVGAASLTSFAESYRGLWLWAQHHGLHGVWAVAWPLQIDTFIGVGELALFVALADSWTVRSRIGAWAVTVLGLAVSVAGNVGHIAGHDLASRATAAVPPLAAAAALAVGLGVLKRVVATHAGTGVPAAAPAPMPVPATAPAAASGHEDQDGNGGLLAWLTSEPGRVPAVPEPPAGLNGHAAAAAELFAADLAAGRVPGIRAIRREMHVGQDRAQQVRAYLAALARTGPQDPRPPAERSTK